MQTIIKNKVSYKSFFDKFKNITQKNIQMQYVLHLELATILETNYI